MKQMAGHLQLAMAPLVFVQKSLLLEGLEPAWLNLSAGETACISDKSVARDSRPPRHRGLRPENFQSLKGMKEHITWRQEMRAQT